MLLFIDKKFIFVFEYELDKLLLVGSQEIIFIESLRRARDLLVCLLNVLEIALRIHLVCLLLPSLIFWLELLLLFFISHLKKYYIIFGQKIS